MTPEERPPRGEAWLGNAAVYEQHRRDCVDLAESAEERGDSEAAAASRAHAETWRRYRDSEQREMERLAMNRRLNARRRYH